MATNQKIVVSIAVSLFCLMIGGIASIYAEEIMGTDKPSPPEILSLARRSAPALLSGDFSDCKLCDLRNHSIVLDREQVNALSPLLVQVILEASRTGELYKTAKADTKKVYVVIPRELAVEFDEAVMAELIGPSGKVIAKWQMWKYVFYEFLPDPEIEWPGSPVVDRGVLGDIGMTLHLFQVIDGKTVTLAKFPLYPMPRN